MISSLFPLRARGFTSGFRVDGGHGDGVVEPQLVGHGVLEHHPHEAGGFENARRFQLLLTQILLGEQACEMVIKKLSGFYLLPGTAGNKNVQHFEGSIK